MGRPTARLRHRIREATTAAADLHKRQLGRIVVRPVAGPALGGDEDLRPALARLHNKYVQFA
jgi:hypothetical protein